MNILKMVTDVEQITTAIKKQVIYGLWIGIFTLDLGPLLKVKVMHTSTMNIMEIIPDWVKITIAIRY